MLQSVDSDDDIVFIEEVRKTSKENESEIQQKSSCDTSVVNNNKQSTKSNTNSDEAPLPDVVPSQLSSSVKHEDEDEAEEVPRPISPWEETCLTNSNQNESTQVEVEEEEPSSPFHTTHSATATTLTSTPVQSELELELQGDPPILHSINTQVTTLKHDEPFVPTSNMIFNPIDSVIIPRKRHEGKKPIFVRTELFDTNIRNMFNVRDNRFKDPSHDDPPNYKSRYSPLRVRLPTPSPEPSPTLDNEGEGSSKNIHRKRVHSRHRQGFQSPVIKWSRRPSHGHDRDHRDRRREMDRRSKGPSSISSIDDESLLNGHQERSRVESLSPGRPGTSQLIRRERESRTRIKYRSSTTNRLSASSSWSRSRENSEDSSIQERKKRRAERFGLPHGKGAGRIASPMRVLHVDFQTEEGLPYVRGRQIKTLRIRLRRCFEDLAKKCALIELKHYERSPRSAWLIYETVQDAQTAKDLICHLDPSERVFRFYDTQRKQQIVLPFRVGYSDKTHFRDE